MATASSNQFPKVIMEEVATDGSATTTPAADHRALFLGEDGALHLKDSAAAITAVGGGVTPGTSFPGSPATGDLIWRTDRALMYYYDGTRWLTVHTFTEPVGSSTASTGSLNLGRMSGNNEDGGIYLEAFDAAFHVAGGSALSGSHKWVLEARSLVGNTATVRGTLNIDSGASDLWRRLRTTIGVALTGIDFFDSQATETGTPGDLFCITRLTYRLIG